MYKKVTKYALREFNKRGYFENEPISDFSREIAMNFPFVGSEERMERILQTYYAVLRYSGNPEISSTSFREAISQMRQRYDTSDILSTGFDTIIHDATEKIEPDPELAQLVMETVRSNYFGLNKRGNALLPFFAACLILDALNIENQKRGNKSIK